MINKLLTLCLLLIFYTAQAQSVTEKALLGKWQVKMVSLNGSGIDFGHDSVFISDELKKELDAEQTGAYIEQLYQALNQYHDMSVTFTKGKIEVFIDGNTVSDNYSIIDKDGVAYLNDGTTQDTIITLPDGDMQWHNIGEGYDMIIRFKKQ